MAEATPTPKPASAQPKTKAKKKAAPAAPPAEVGLVGAWRVWGIAGLLLVGSVVAWKLVGSSYRGDIEIICNGEKGSGYTADKDMPKVTQWVRDHLGTPEGNEFFSTLGDAKMFDRAKQLQAKSTELKIDPCPLVGSIQKVAAEGEYRADVQRLCSRLTFPKLEEMSDDARLGQITQWIGGQAKSPRTKELLDPLQQAPPGDRSKVLSDAANKIDIFSCDTAKTLLLPVQAPKTKGPPMVRPYASPQIIGGMQEADLAKAIVDATPAMTQCYAKGLEKNPDLAGRLAMKVQIDPSGKVTNVGIADTKVNDKDTVACIAQALREMHAPANAGPLVSVMLPLELSTIVGTPGHGALTAPGGPEGLPPMVLPSPSSSAHPSPSSSAHPR